MSSVFGTLRYNRKWTGSPQKLQKMEKKELVKRVKKGLGVGEANREEDNILLGWQFQCRCGASGENYDDGRKSLQCDICKLWMHCRCNKVPEKHDDLLLFFYRKRVWVCMSCKKGEYRYLGEFWKEPEEYKGESKVSFDERNLEVTLAPKQLTIKERALNKTASPMLQRRNAHVRSVGARNVRRNADSASSLTAWQQVCQQGENDEGTEDLSPFPAHFLY